MSDTTNLSDVRRHTNLRIPVHGDTVAATRYQPVEETEPSPALLMYVPYHQDDGITYGAYDPLNRYLAKHGYEVVVADMAGTGASTGFIGEPFTRREGTEPAEIVQWLADQPWTTGRIGMFGKSYGGITALDAAGQQPDALEAIVPIHTPYQGFRNAYTYGGLFEFLTIGMDWLTLMQALDAKPSSRLDDEGQWKDSWLGRLERMSDREPWLFQFMENNPEESYWEDKNIPVDNIETPTLAVGGWRDPYTEDTLQYFEAIDAPKRLLLGPWRHQMPHRGRESAIDFRKQVVEWFDHFLKDKDNGVLASPEIQVWTELDGGGTNAGQWRGFSQWPTVDDSLSETVAFAVTPDGLESPDTYHGDEVNTTYEFDPTVGISSADPYGVTFEPPATNDDDARTLTFETDRLDNPVELTGTGEVTVRVQSTVADPTVVVRVVDVDPDGQGTLVTTGAVRGRYRDGLDSPADMEPGKEHELTIPLEPKSHIFEEGHQIRVAIGSSFFPVWLPTPERGSFTLRSDPENPTVVRFPGRARKDVTFDDPIEMDQPDDVLPTSPTRAAGESSWETSRERVEGEARATKAHDIQVSLPHGALSRESTHEASVKVDDPASASARNEMRIEFTNDLGDFEVVASNYISHSLCRLNTTVKLDGETVYEESWTK
ncbi:CocE/NonD family hydrolase [Halorussus salinisoli]|uniref:CocE/NonD family hydrolase n=1 Tax=Halorussus salinisoli TaxID=2558242 RepID=UPI0010C22AA2|nr:CocE/NonD family hydrolase [Halorussus salinisoli]